MEQKMSKLIKAITAGKIDEARRLIQEGADLEARDKYGWTALIIAAYWGRKEIVKMLLDAGADVNVVDKDGFTALHYAASGGYKEVVEMLERRQTKVVAVNTTQDKIVPKFCNTINLALFADGNVIMSMAYAEGVDDVAIIDRIVIDVKHAKQLRDKLNNVLTDYGAKNE